MGIEVFGVSLEILEPGVYPKLRMLLSDYSHTRIGDEELAANYAVTYGEYKDKRHFIDIYISRDLANNRCKMAIRFSLCSFESIDNILLDIVKLVLSSFDAEVWLMTSALNQKNYYLPGDQNWLIAALPDEIAAMRNYWQGLFGNKQGFVQVKDSFAFVGLKY